MKNSLVWISAEGRPALLQRNSWRAGTRGPQTQRGRGGHGPANWRFYWAVTSQVLPGISPRSGTALDSCRAPCIPSALHLSFPPVLPVPSRFLCLHCSSQWKGLWMKPEVALQARFCSIKTGGKKKKKEEKSKSFVAKKIRLLFHLYH